MSNEKNISAGSPEDDQDTSRPIETDPRVDQEDTLPLKPDAAEDPIAGGLNEESPGKGV
ncbi:MAG: hypothetical protein ACQERF_03100 [Actinomycetota bacterium]